MMQRWPEIVFLASTTAAGLWAGGRWMDPIGDPGFGWSVAYRLANGERLYRDIYVAYGPFTPYFLAGWAKVFGVSSRSVLVVNWFAALIVGLLLLEVARRFLSGTERLALVAMILAVGLFAPGPGRLILPYYPGVVHALIFGLAALLCVVAEPLRPRFLYLAGFLAGLAFCCKQEIGIAALAALCGALVARTEFSVTRATRVIAGFAVITLLGAAFAAWCAPVSWLRERDRLWPLSPRPPMAFDALYRTVSGLADPNWFASLRGAAWRLLFEIALIAAAAGLLARERLARSWRRLFWLFGGLSLWWAVERFPLGAATNPIQLSVLVSCCLALAALFKRDLEGRTVLVGLGVFAALVGSRALFSPFESGPYEGPAHFAATASWALLLFVFTPRWLWPQAERARKGTRAAIALALLVSIGWSAATRAAAIRFPWKQAVETPNGRVYTDAGHARLLREIGLRAKSGERVVVLPEINAVDALYGVRSETPLPHNVPGWLDRDREKELIRRLQADPPSKLVLFVRPTPEFGVAPFGAGFGVDLFEWCRRNYRAVWASPRGSILERRFELLPRDTRGPSRTGAAARADE